MIQYFPEPYGSYKMNVKLKLHLSNNITKFLIKERAGHDTKNWHKTVYLKISESDVDKFDEDKVKIDLVDLKYLASCR